MMLIAPSGKEQEGSIIVSVPKAKLPNIKLFVRYSKTPAESVKIQRAYDFFFTQNADIF